MSDGPKTTKNVLVVEDEPDFAALIASVLRKQGYEVAIACDGEEALKEVNRSAPDLITLDIQMPRKGGLHFFREMKSHDEFRRIPVVVITGVTRGDPDMETLLQSFLEVDHVPAPEARLEKPFDNQELIDIVARALAAT